MSQTHCNLIYHLVFSTKGRVRFLTPNLRGDVHRYLAGAVQGVDGIPLIINGTEDHVHLLVKLSQNHALKNVLSEIKSNSSGWIHRTWPALSDFAWQAGYGAFTVSASQKETVYRYVQNQEVHHAKYTFKAEYLGFLKAHEVEYDPQYIWD
ncbi:MAG: IS200/IS605 family transposase [Candidatus Hydrogenedentes bacterium]|nr:IS200/IS605 family transposase [Candidatus Hydrogenedentota bacterium]